MNEFKGYVTDKIPQTTVDFLKDLEILCYDLCKLAQADTFLRNRYLKAYVAGGILLRAFEAFLDMVLNDYEHKLKYDLSHIAGLHKCFQ